MVDDDEDDREIFQIALQKTGINATLITASNGAAAIEKLSSDGDFIPDYIFLDVNMPGMNGTVCLNEIKKIQRLNAVPVIIYSTSSNPLNEEETRRLKASHYLIKPPDVKVLSGMITAIATTQNLPFTLKAEPDMA